jgi:hypothetical protein
MPKRNTYGFVIFVLLLLTAACQFTSLYFALFRPSALAFADAFIYAAVVFSCFTLLAALASRFWPVRS